LYRYAAGDSPSEDVARWLVGDLRRMTAEERTAREQLVADGVVRSRRYAPKKLAAMAAAAKLAKDAAESAAAGAAGAGVGGSAALALPPTPGSAAAAAAAGDADSAAAMTRLALEAALDPLDAAESLLPLDNANGVYDRECTICRYILHLSGVACTCNPDRPACLRHSAELCDCPNSHRVMFYRKSIAQLERLVSDTERACGKRAKPSEKEKAFGAARARQKRAAAWVKKAKDALAQKAPPTPTAELEAILVGAEEFTWGGEDMDDVRRAAAKVGIAIAFQRELAVLKRRINTEDGGDAENGTGSGNGSGTDARGGWADPVVDDADVVAAAAAAAPMRARRGGRYAGADSGINGNIHATEQETAAKRQAEAAAANGVKEEEGGGGGSVKDEDAMDVDSDDGGGGGGGLQQHACNGGGSSINGNSSKKDAPGGSAPPRRMALTRLRELLTAASFPLPAADSESFQKALTAGEDLESRVVAALGERPNPSPKKCISLVAEVARGPLEVTSARRLKDAVAAAHAWSDRLRKALPGRRHRPARAELPRLADLSALRADAANLPVQPNDLSSLDTAAEETQAWASRAETLLAMDPVCGLEQAEALLEEGLDLPTHCPEVETLGEAVASARAWAEEAQTADAANKSLQILTELLDAGEAMTVGTEELEMLRERIRVREWADHARQVAVGKPEPTPLDEVRDLVTAGAAIIEGGGSNNKTSGKSKASAAAAAVKPPVNEEHVTDFERSLLERLRASVANGEAWEKKAAALISEADAGKLRPLEDAERLVKEAQAISASLESYLALSDAASAARSWVEKAQQCLKGKQLTRRGTAAPPPTLAHAERLIREAGRFIVLVRELGALTERVASAKVWGEQAEEAVEQWREEGAEQTFTELLLDHERFGLELPAAADVRACLAALEWEREARAALSEKSSSSLSLGVLGAGGGGGGSPGGGGGGDRKSGGVKRASVPLLSLLEDLRARAKEIYMDDLEEGLEDGLNRRLAAVEEWDARVDRALRGGGGLAASKTKSAEKAAAAAAAVAERRPTPEAMREFIEEGRRLPAVVPRVAELEIILEEHQKWTGVARALLGPPKPKPTAEELAAAAAASAAAEAEEAAAAAAGDEAVAAVAVAAEVERKRSKDKKKKKKGKGGKAAAAAEAAAAVGVDAAAAEAAKVGEKLRCAAAAASIAAAVAERLAARDTGPDARPAIEDVKQMQLTGESLPLKSEEGIELAAAVAAAAAWSERLRKILVRPRSSAGVHAIAVDDPATALALIAHSVRAAVVDLEGTGEPPESEEGQFCLCRQPGGREMLGCDICGDWYHLRCAGVTASFARNAKNYTCQACCAGAGDVFKLNKPDVVYKHIHRTRRPTLTSLGEILLEAMDFSGKLPEEDQLVEVFREYTNWKNAVAAAMERKVAVEAVEAVATAARDKADAAAAAAAVLREARLARAAEVRERAAAVQQAQVSAGATAMAAALLGAGGGGTAAAALEAAQRCAHLPPDQQLDMLGQQVAAAAAIKQQQLMQLKGAVAAAAAAGLAGGDGGADSVAAAAESASPFEAMLVSQLQELGTFVHQLATCQQQVMQQQQQQQPPGSQGAATQQYQVLIQVMMMMQHFLTLSKQQDMQLDALGGGLLEQQRVAAAAAAKAAEQDEEDDVEAIAALKEEAEAREAAEAEAAAADAAEAEAAAADAAAAAADAADAPVAEGDAALQPFTVKLVVHASAAAADDKGKGPEQQEQEHYQHQQQEGADAAAAGATAGAGKQEEEDPEMREAPKTEPVDAEMTDADAAPAPAPAGGWVGSLADSDNSPPPEEGWNLKQEGEEEGTGAGEGAFEASPTAAAALTVDVGEEEAGEEEPSSPPPPAPTPTPRRRKAPEGPSEEETALEAAAAALAAEAQKAAAVLAAAAVPNPARQIFAGLKGALAMEIEHHPADGELPALLREVCGAAWHVKARAALSSGAGSPAATAANADADAPSAAPVAEEDFNAKHPTLSQLTALREEGVACGCIIPGVTTPAAPPPGPDALGDEVAAMEAKGQAWLDRAADAVDREKKVPVEEVLKLMEEGRKLPINLKEELEELGERCEVYCLCKSAYDAARPMISCDKCEGWFHYEVGRCTLTPLDP
jgi:hypothetical protein